LDEASAELNHLDFEMMNKRIILISLNIVPLVEQIFDVNVFRFFFS